MLDQGRCSFVELSPEPFQELFPVLCHPPCEQVFPEALPEPPILQF